MYLQSLELFGFKSFAQKTTVHFDRGVTAVVGPNGCGKSNVLDGIRWVLGEQSAKALRGGEMADVIFSGTDSRPALGMAEVSLRFAECEKELGVEWNEVQITRRVFRDGRSEYLLNKAPCRLRDIQQLFMDTGIGRSAYSIMEQGKIDQLVSSKPEDRRAIFEEAAGITRFKSQRKEALRKLEATEANLLRVTDIIKEVKRQIGSLQRQVGKARRYQALISDLRTLDTHFSHHQYDALNGSLTAASSEIERLRDAHGTQQQQIEERETQVALRRHELEALEETLNTARQAVQDLRNQISGAEHRVAFNHERVAESASLVERYESDITAAQEKLQAQEEQIESADLELAGIIQTLELEQTQLNERAESVRSLTAGRLDAERAAQTAVSEISRLENRLSSLRGEMSGAMSARDGSEARLSILGEELLKLTETNDRLTLQNSEVAAQLLQQQESLTTSQNEARETGENAKAIQAELEQQEKGISAEQRKLTEKESRLEVLLQLNAEGEGLSEGAQAVLRGLDNPEFFKPSILGALASQIEVAPEFIIAVEAALGQNLQAILLKDTMVAESVVKTLTTKKWGRALIAIREFLPSQNTAEAHEQSASSTLPTGALAWVSEKVVANHEVAPLVKQLLRDIALVPTLEVALQSRTQFPALSFVTLAGEFLSREGIVNGGANSEETSNSMLQRKNQIAQLEQEAAAARSSLAALLERRDETLARLEATRSRLAEAHSEAQQIQLAVSTLRGQAQQIERELSDAAKRQQTVGWERENIQTRHDEASAKLGSLEENVSATIAQIAESQTRQSEAQTRLEELRAQESVLQSELNEMRIKVATERQRHSSLQNQRQPMAARLVELRELVSQRQRDVDQYTLRGETLAQEIEEIQETIESLRAQVGEAEGEVSQRAEERATMSAGMEEFDATLRILRRQLTECSEQRGQHEVRQTQLQMRIESICEHVTRRYQIDVREFQPDTFTLLTTLRDLHKKNRVANGEAANSDAESTREDAMAVSESPSQDEGSQSLSQPANREPQSVDWTRIEEIVRDMTQRVDAMGPVNLDAIQEYEELEQRHQFLEQQINDLTSAKTELLDVIAKINTTTRTMFAETFEKIRVNFQTMFTELFGGGKANLVLTDESDPLESGIDIIAKPPGKQLQSITLLSGGEKAMTAVSLLFSIYMVKPSPFCVLDEIDAPLDESNIMRFVKILDRFVGQSQFVVITHSKRTISRADVLYGVTMEEHGISKLVSMRFSERDKATKGVAKDAAASEEHPQTIAESLGKSGNLHSETVAAGS